MTPIGEHLAETGMVQALVVLVVGVAGLWAALRAIHIGRLSGEVRRPLGETDAGGTATQPVDEQQTRVAALVDAGALSGASAVGVVWQWARIDPQVIRAIDFASAAEVDSGFELVTWVANEHGTAAAISDKARDRLLGYVGEQQAAERLADAGHMVTLADTPNNAAWDLLVDGVRVDVKTVADTGHVDVGHDDVTYLVPEDAAGTTVADNVERLEGLSHAEATDSLEAALADTAASVGLTGPVPVAAVALAGWRETRAVRRGKDVAAAVEHGAADATIKGTAVVAGGSVGTAVGESVGGAIEALGGPLGAAAGGVVGAGVGAVASSPLVGRIKTRRLRRANAALAGELAAYGRARQERLDELERWARWPRQRADAALAALTDQAAAVRRTLRWKLWPTYGQVAAVEAATLGAQRRDDLARRVADTEQLLRTAREGDTTQLGAALLAAPDLLDRLGGRDPEARQRIEAARSRAERERRNLAGAS
jgi:hypothetical protein